MKRNSLIISNAFLLLILTMASLRADQAISGAAGMQATPTPLSPDAEKMQTGKFEPNWQSLKQYQVPEWYRDAKFGIWAHWGPQCEPEDGDWYARNMYIQGSKQYNDHLKAYGHPSVAGFKDIIRVWKAENWDPDKLVALYKDAGAKFFVALANHHDNFDLWDSKYQPWNSVAMGPRKDLIAGWAKAARDNGLPFGVSIHAAHAWSWYEPSQGSDSSGDKAGVPYDGKLTKEDGAGLWWDGFDPQDLYAQSHKPGPLVWNWDAKQGSSVPDAAYCEKFYNRTLDLIDKYHPDLVYFDDTVLPLYPISDVGLKIAAHFYNSNALWHDGQNQGVVLGKILNTAQKKCLVWDVERGASTKIEPLPWQSETCLGNWHYDRAVYDNHGYKHSDTVIHTLADVVSKNGTFLLNVPVRGDGTIDDQEVDIVKAIGRWMKVNGEAIYATRPWKVCGEGPGIEHARGLSAQGFNEGQVLGFRDIRYTTKGNVLYAIVLGWPTEPVVLNKLGKSAGLLPGSISNIEVMGSDERIDWKQGDDAVTIQPAQNKLFDEATVFKCTLTAPPNSGAPAPGTAADDASNILSPDDVVAPLRQTTKGQPSVFAHDGDFGGDKGTDEQVANAIDGDETSKYFNHAQDGSNPPGVNTGFVVTPVKGAKVITGVQFATANDLPNRDPLKITIEGSNESDAGQEQAKNFTLIYEGTSGLDSDPGRGNWGQFIRFPNTTAYKTYRVLVTQPRSADADAIQYAEVKLISAPAKP